MSSRNWLRDAARDSLRDVTFTDDLDAAFSARALLARDDRDARDALFWSLAERVADYVDRYRRVNLAPWTPDDVAQEAYLAYVETLDAWRPPQSATRPAGFGYFFLYVFPRRLDRRVRRMLRADFGRVKCHIDGVPANLADPLTFESQIEALVTLDALRRRLTVRDGLIVYLRVVADAPPTEVAIRINASERTVRRRLARITPLVREYLAG